VEKILAAANASSYWYEKFPEKMKLDPWHLAYDYMSAQRAHDRGGAAAQASLRSSWRASTPRGADAP